MVQFPITPKETGKPELAVALTVKSGALKGLSANGSSVIVWFPLSTESGPFALSVAKVESPGKVAETALG